jgi:hypothetical protein
MSAPRILGPNGKPATSHRQMRARYDAGWQSPYRSFSPTPIQSAAADITTDRQSLLALARRWDQNAPLIHGILERLVTYTIGCGLNPVPSSSSGRWNKKVSNLWDEWKRKPEITERFSWGVVQSITWRSALRDGDSFLLLTTDDAGEPKVQMIEGHRIREPNAPIGFTVEPPDGVVRDAVGRHIAYKLCRDDGVLERRLAGEAVVQFLLPERPDQPRGVSLFAAALKTIHNLDDILRLEQIAVKDSSSKLDYITTPTGSLSPEQAVTYEGEEFPPIGQDAIGYYQNSFGPETRVLRTGDEFHPYVPQRPSPAWQGFVGYLTDSIPLSLGLPPSVLVPGKLGGVDSRKDMAAAARVFERWQWAQADGYQRVYEFAVQAWMESGKIGNAPKDWRNTSWQMPRSITGDAGRQTQADIDLVASGMMSLRDYFGELGWDGNQKVAELIAEQKAILEGDPTGMMATRLYSKVGAVLTAGDAWKYPATPKQEPAPGEEQPADEPAPNPEEQEDEESDE